MNMKIICTNRKAAFEYFVQAKYTAGIVLEGFEVKPVRDKKCNINQAYISFKESIPVIYGMNIDSDKNAFIPHLKNGPNLKYDPKRVRTLLLKKKEINKLIGKITEEGLTLIPLNVFISSTGYVKVEFGLCKGKKLFDKRASMKEKEIINQARNAYRL